MRESGLEQATISESSHIVRGTSRYKRETMENTHKYIRTSMLHFPRSMLCTTQVDSSLLDAYEIERISKDLDSFIQSSCDKHYRRKFVDVVSDPSSLKIMSLFRSSSGTKEDKTIKEKKWFGFRGIYKLCKSMECGVVENVQFPASKEGRRIIL